MKDQELSDDGARGRDAAESATGAPKGSRTPPVGAANGRRGPIKIETPPLSFGTPISTGVPAYGEVCVCGHTLLAHLSPDPHEVGVLGCSGFRPVPIGTPISVPGPIPDLTGHLTDAEVSAFHDHLAEVGSHPPAPGHHASHERASGRLPSSNAAVPGAGTFRDLLFAPVIFVLALIARLFFVGYPGDADE